LFGNTGVLAVCGPVPAGVPLWGCWAGSGFIGCPPELGPMFGVLGWVEKARIKVEKNMPAEAAQELRKGK